MSLHSMKAIISGGGTGGHIFPAIAIADALKELVPGIEILFVGAKGRMEMEKVPAAGYPIEGLWISGLQRSLSLKNLSFPFKLIHSTINARRIIKQFKPDVVIGVGGYASGPTLRAAASMHIPTVLQEQNSYPGITNKLLASKADFICVAYTDMERFFPKEKIIITGNPVRKQLLNSKVTKPEAVNHFNLNPNKPVVLSVGGSLGARTLNESIDAGLQEFINAGIQLIWQTGKGYAQTAIDAVKRYNTEDIKPLAFIDKMDLAYAAADIVISRAGAIAISELCLRSKPCILVPSPNVAEDHQTKNAMSLVSSGAAIMISDASAREKLVEATINLAKDKESQQRLSQNIYKLGYPDAAVQIARIAINCASSNKKTLT
ncbi:MAG: undecaprenyldiphospho-muramoylpentapeptide beta-N-acetylglucosaminyltransferase [Omnitrophica WOR_2 bacterium]